MMGRWPSEGVRLIAEREWARQWRRDNQPGQWRTRRRAAEREADRRRDVAETLDLLAELRAAVDESVADLTPPI